MQRPPYASSSSSSSSPASRPPIPSTSQSRLDDFMPSSPSQPAGLTSTEQVRLTSHQQRVYVLCGVVGSGKSTLASQFEALYPKDYVRVNQDALGNRKKCEDLARWALSEGKSVLIDRQNFDASQRYTWLKIGHEAHVEVVALVFQTSKETCAERLKLRRFHETVKSPEQALSILDSMVSIITPPEPMEGFHRILYLSTSLPHRYKLSDINTILAQVDQAADLPGVLPDIVPEPTPRGSSFRPTASRGLASRGGGASRGRGGMSGSSSIGGNNRLDAWLTVRNGPNPPEGTSPALSGTRSAFTSGARQHAVPAAGLPHGERRTMPPYPLPSARSPSQEGTESSAPRRNTLRPIKNNDAVVILD